MRNIIVAVMALALPSVEADAQFYTVARTETAAVWDAHGRKGKDTDVTETGSAENDTARFHKSGSHITCNYVIKKGSGKPSGRLNNQKGSGKVMERKNGGGSDALPELTLANLYDEIVRNGILFPKIVLAQAILETGWFRSHACRMKNNLFGLTNPKTGKHFEFGHWTESVRAYYSKVQYKYKGGDYLLWLRKIGYAEDPNYVRSVIKVLKML